jgi:hypothetical protein
MTLSVTTFSQTTLNTINTQNNKKVTLSIMTLSIMALSLMAEYCYAVSFMLILCILSVLN